MPTDTPDSGFSGRVHDVFRRSNCLHTGPSHTDAKDSVFQPGNSLAARNAWKDNPFTGPSEVHDSHCEKSGLIPDISQALEALDGLRVEFNLPLAGQAPSLEHDVSSLLQVLPIAGGQWISDAI